MAKTIYSNNGVEITLEFDPPYEYKVKVNNSTLITISSDSEEEFTEGLRELLDQHRI